jgi:hypothetical protein
MIPAFFGAPGEKEGELYVFSRLLILVSPNSSMSLERTPELPVLIKDPPAGERATGR